jgi:hypothetical protein
LPDPPDLVRAVKGSRAVLHQKEGAQQVDYHVRVETEDGHRNVFVTADDATGAEQAALEEAAKNGETAHDTHVTPLSG